MIKRITSLVGLITVLALLLTACGERHPDSGRRAHQYHRSRGGRHRYTRGRGGDQHCAGGDRHRRPRRPHRNHGERGRVRQDRHAAAGDEDGALREPGPAAFKAKLKELCPDCQIDLLQRQPGRPPSSSRRPRPR